MVDVPPFEFPNTDFECLDPRLGAEAERLTPTRDLKEVQIGPYVHQVANISTFLSVEKERELVYQLIKNADLFVWDPSNMPRMYTKVVSHRLSIYPSAKPVAQRKRKIEEGKMAAIDEEVVKLSDSKFIT